MIWRYEETAVKLLTQGGTPPARRIGREAQERLESVAAECGPWIMPHLRGMPRRRQHTPSIIYIYAFVKADQRHHKCADGLCSTFLDNRVAAIGIADDVIAGDAGYLRLTFLHELAHLEHIGHGPDYVLHLNRLISEFNEATGAKLSNDLDYTGRYLDSKGHYLHRADGRTRCTA